MGWHTTTLLLLVLLAHQYIISPTSGVLHHVLSQTPSAPFFNDDDEPPLDDDNDNNVSLDASNNNNGAFRLEHGQYFLKEMEDEKLEKLGNILAKLLLIPWPQGSSPLVYVEQSSVEEDNPIVQDDQDYPNDLYYRPSYTKRTRYYRRYPWKRQNSRYDAENKYLCQPSKDDVFRLLVALHDARNGNRGHVVNFCNRKRPAASVFNHIRFVGKRK